MSASIIEEQALEISQKLSGPNFQLIPTEGSTTLVIFFSGTGKDEGRFDFWNVGRRVDANQLFVSDGRNFWYRAGVNGLGENLEQTIDTIKNYCQEAGITKIVTVGASMGGYGAVLFAALLGGSAIAFSFDSVLGLPTSPSQRLMAKDAPNVHHDLVPLVESTGTPVRVYVGEFYTIDLVGAQRMAHLPTVTIETLKGVDHATARFINETIGLTEIISAFAHERDVPPSKSAGDIFKRPQLVKYLYSAHLNHSRKNMARCIHYCLHALKYDPYSEPVRLLLGKAYLSEKRYPEALEQLCLVATMLPGIEEAVFYFANALRAAKRLTVANEVLTKGVEKFPHSSRLNLNLALTREALKDAEGARKFMRIAVSLDPKFADKETELHGRLQSS